MGPLYGPGTPREELPALTAAILGLAPGAGTPVTVQAATLARTSPHSAQAWQAALDIIADGAGVIPGADPDELLAAVTRLTGLGYHPAVSAHHLVAACLYVAPVPPTARQRATARLTAPWRRLTGRWQLRGQPQPGATDDPGDPGEDDL